jgi:hypothetical protein
MRNAARRFCEMIAYRYRQRFLHKLVTSAFLDLFKVWVDLLEHKARGQPVCQPLWLTNQYIRGSFFLSGLCWRLSVGFLSFKGGNLLRQCTVFSRLRAGENDAHMDELTSRKIRRGNMSSFRFGGFFAVFILMRQLSLTFSTCLSMARKSCNLSPIRQLIFFKAWPLHAR